jgi:SulP family sulfate permease
LGSIIIVAVIGLIDFNIPKKLWQSDKKELFVYVITFLSTLFIGIQEGIMIGVLLSFLVLIFNVSYPYIAILGQIKGTNEYRNVKRYKDLKLEKGIIVIRLDARLFYANMNYFKDKLYEAIVNHEHDVRLIVITGKAINGMDFSAIKMIQLLDENLGKKGIDLYFSGFKGPVVDKIRKTDLIKDLIENRSFLSIDKAIEEYQSNNK